MDRDELRAAHAPLKDRYKNDPASACTRLHAEGDYRDERITCTVSTPAGPVRSGLHPATGGNGQDAGSGDMAAAGTRRTHRGDDAQRRDRMGIEIGTVHIAVDSSFDARGTLGIDRTVDVGVAPITLTISTTGPELDPGPIESTPPAFASLGSVTEIHLPARRVATAWTLLTGAGSKLRVRLKGPVVFVSGVAACFSALR